MESVDFIFIDNTKDTRLGLTYLFMSFGLNIQRFQDGHLEGFFASPKVDGPVPREIQELCNEQLDVFLTNKERTRFVIASISKKIFYFIKVFTEFKDGKTTETAKREIVTSLDITEALNKIEKKVQLANIAQKDSDIINQIWKNTVN